MKPAEVRTGWLLAHSHNICGAQASNPRFGVPPLRFCRQQTLNTSSNYFYDFQVLSQPGSIPASLYKTFSGLLSFLSVGPASPSTSRSVRQLEPSNLRSDPESIAGGDPKWNAPQVVSNYRIRGRETAPKVLSDPRQMVRGWCADGASGMLTRVSSVTLVYGVLPEWI